MVKCHFCGKESFFEMCEACIKKQNTDRTEKIWKNNIKLADDLGKAYYDFLLKEYNKNTLKKDSKENWGFNTFCDGIRIGLDTIMPLLDDAGIKTVKQKIKNMLKIREQRKR
ncbi:MAG: hypothetical protein KKA65_03690 [Nanoarchaeota archaeon]|nr:hypothetical protein [Nanoarchaeota archaeon]MBU4456580.1 hypothetical protein [Nanoarchaeota archaeon]